MSSPGEMTGTPSGVTNWPVLVAWVTPTWYTSTWKPSPVMVAIFSPTFAVGLAHSGPSPAAAGAFSSTGSGAGSDTAGAAGSGALGAAGRQPASRVTAARPPWGAEGPRVG